MAHSNCPAGLKARLAAGQPLYGAFLCSFSPSLAEILGYSGYDYVVVDMEHGPGDTIAALPCLQALKAAGTFSVLRIAANDPPLAKKALDLGPDGIMIPMVQTSEEAAMAVAACRYPPKGIRGAACGIIRASKYGINPGYSRKVEDELLVMLQIESKKGVENVTEIAAVEGVDCLMMGPRDLSSSIGYLDDPAGDQEVNELLHRAERDVLAAKRSGLFLAGMARAKDPPPAMFHRGYHMVVGTADISLFRDAALGDIQKHKPVLR